MCLDQGISIAEGESDAIIVCGTQCKIGGGTEMSVRAGQASRIMVVGGEPIGERHIYWNFVSSSKARIEKAKSDWRERKFAEIPGEHEFIPLPE